MKKFMDLYERKAARQRRALQQAEKLKVQPNPRHFDIIPVGRDGE